MATFVLPTLGSTFRITAWPMLSKPAENVASLHCLLPDPKASFGGCSFVNLFASENE
jgi:hypothetical protein